MKYLVMGAFSSAFMLYGIALMFAVVGSINYNDITNYFSASPELGTPDHRGGRTPTDRILI